MRIFPINLKIAPIYLDDFPVYPQDCFSLPWELCQFTLEDCSIYLEDCSSLPWRLFQFTLRTVPVYLQDCSSLLWRLLQFTLKIVPVYLEKLSHLNLFQFTLLVDIHGQDWAVVDGTMDPMCTSWWQCTATEDTAEVVAKSAAVPDISTPVQKYSTIW